MERTGAIATRCNETGRAKYQQPSPDFFELFAHLPSEQRPHPSACTFNANYWQAQCRTERRGSCCQRTCRPSSRLSHHDVRENLHRRMELHKAPEVSAVMDCLPDSGQASVGAPRQELQARQMLEAAPSLKPVREPLHKSKQLGCLLPSNVSLGFACYRSVGGSAQCPRLCLASLTTNVGPSGATQR